LKTNRSRLVFFRARWMLTVHLVPWQGDSRFETGPCSLEARMLKSLLIVVTWLQGGPVVQTQLLDSPAQCRLAAQSAAQMIQLQARSNLNSPHNELLLTQDPHSREWRLATGTVGREVARLRCAEPDAQPTSGAGQKPLFDGERQLPI
jgi:hypothetical protein